jgi:cytochrome P450
VGCCSTHSLLQVLEDIVIRTVVPFYKFIPTPRQFEIRKFAAKSVEMQERLMTECIQRAKTDPDAPETILSLMLKTQNSPDGGLSDSEIANELQTIRGAGHETTSNTLCWTMLLLARDPRVLAKLREEVETTVKVCVCLSVDVYVCL